MSNYSLDSIGKVTVPDRLDGFEDKERISIKSECGGDPKRRLSVPVSRKKVKYLKHWQIFKKYDILSIYINTNRRCNLYGSTSVRFYKKNISVLKKV